MNRYTLNRLVPSDPSKSMHDGGPLRLTGIWDPERKVWRNVNPFPHFSLFRAAKGGATGSKRKPGVGANGHGRQT